MAKTKCIVCKETKVGMVKVEPFGYFCSGCIDKTVEKLNEAHDALYIKFILPTMSKIISDRLDDEEFDLEDFIENNPYFSEEIMFNVVTDMINAEKNKDVILRLMDAARIKSLGMEFVDYDESE